MCLGASALNIHQQVATEANLNQSKQQQGCYVAPNVLAKLNKSSTLPANCHQQILHQLLSQQQQQQQNPSASQQEASQGDQQQVIDSLILANMMQQQQQQHCTNGDAFLALAQAGEQGPEVAALMEQQLQHQVYATVKRGCPRPPRLCGEYTIYQCPNGQQVAEGHQQMRCCDGSNSQPTEFTCNYNHHHQQSQLVMQPQQPQDTCLQQSQLQQQQQSDYQQLRPIN